MKYDFELPVVQVARIQSVQDLEWIVETLREGRVFNCMIFSNPATDSRDVYKFENAKVFASDKHVAFYKDKLYFPDKAARWHGSDNITIGCDYVVWNQGKEAYAVFESGDFTSQMIPPELRQLVVVE